jgi:adenine-specific DNA-methyltransferase
MAQTENQKKLLKILNEIFQLDQSDLDFGIYRIMNSKSKEINEFLDKDLLSSVASAFSSNDNNSIQKELDEAIQQAQSLGADPETLPKVIALREQLSTTSTSSNLENEVFSHLANFFKRYYKDGDFVSLRRYKKDTYAIPYEGEEVKLHWANSDQYYIKSGEYFRDYTFTVNDKTIHLKLSDAETESNNNKATSDKERRFVILENNPCEVIDDELYINFEYKAIGKVKKEKLNEETIVKALESIEDLEFITALNTLAPTEGNKNRTIFEKHLNDYTSRNSFDYFIHKDLGGFLSRELDFYIKNEILFLDDIMDSPIKYEEVMAKIKIFKSVSQKIISFLTQLEELQKKLWEKKKFIIETNYCITLDKIDEEHYEQILACDEQLAEWKELFDVDIKTIDELKEEKHLVLDTKFFDMKFKYKLLSEFDNLDEDIDGVLINSENFGALNLLQSRYKEQVKTVYIDPPYNTEDGDFLYKDNFKHSSWISLIQDRIVLGKNLMSNDGVIFNHIGEQEFDNFKYILDDVFQDNKIGFISRIQKKGSDKGTYFKPTLDFILAYAKDKSKLNGFKVGVDESKFKKVEEEGLRKGELYEDSKSLYQSSLDSRPNQRYYIKCPDGSFAIPPGNVFPSIVKDMEKITPLNNNDKVWRWEQNSCQNQKQLLVFKKTKSSPLVDENGNQSKWNIYTKRYLLDAQKKGNIPSNLFENFLNGTATTTLSKLGIDFPFSKPKELIEYLITITNTKTTILDFFAGSGTTGHAIIDLNRIDKKNRKYLLVDMGEYFTNIMKPRIQKVIYSDSWKDGKPTTKNGVSQIFKYFKLESYEDTLNNLEFKKTKEQQATLDMYPQSKEDYILNYSLDVESQGSLLNIDTFSTPFDYKLKIATSSVGETKDTNIDLVETFNYLLGLVVKRIELLKGYLVVEGQNLKKEKILIIWRDGQSSDELNEFFKKMDWSVYDREFDTIYVNGDNNLDNLRKDEDHHKVKLIEQEFKKLMFGE